MLMKVWTLTALVHNGLVQAVIKIDEMTNNFIATHEVISVGGIDAMPPSFGIMMITRTMCYEDHDKNL